MSKNKAIVLFSGGLDSSLAACYMIEKGFDVELFHFDQGALISNNLVEVRCREIQNAYPASSIMLHNLKSNGPFRKIALTTIEADILQYQVSLVCVGCKLAMHAETIAFCLNNQIQVVADGSTAKQRKYGEQRPVAIDFIRLLYKDYGIEYKNPIFDLDKATVKYNLLDRNITIQSLEIKMGNLLGNLMVFQFVTELIKATLGAGLCFGALKWRRGLLTTTAIGWGAVLGIALGYWFGFFSREPLNNYPQFRS